MKDTEQTSQETQNNLSASPKEEIPGAGKLGMYIFIASLSMLFIASMMGYLVIRSRAEQWPPPGMPNLPGALWLSTLWIILSSITIQFSFNAIRRNHIRKAAYHLVVTFCLGFIFLVTQISNWYGLIQADILKTANLYAFTFYMLTGLHAIHVLGGLIPMGIVFVKTFKNRYSHAYYPGIQYCTIYWHFLMVVWLIMFVLLQLAG